MLISIIMLSGGELSDLKLRRHLQRLNADQNVAGDRTDNVLSKLQKQSYIIKKVERLPGSDEETVGWVVGPRGREEVGLDGVAGMVREIYGGSTPVLEKKISASLGIQIRPQAVEEEVVDNGEADEERHNGRNDGGAANGSTSRRSSRRIGRRNMDD
jgi:melanoma-associated antigen